MALHPITIGNKHHGAKGEYIGRGSPLGNPYPIGPNATREAVIEAYIQWLGYKVFETNSPEHKELERLYAIAKDRPLTLVCFCHPKPCHGEIVREALIQIAKDRGDT